MANMSSLLIVQDRFRAKGSPQTKQNTQGPKEQEKEKHQAGYKYDSRVRLIMTLKYHRNPVGTRVAEIAPPCPYGHFVCLRFIMLI